MAKLTITGDKAILNKIIREQRLRSSKYGLKLTLEEGKEKVEVKKEKAPEKPVVKTDTNKPKKKNFFGK